MKIDTVEGFQADASALADLAAERIALTVCMPAAHTADPDDIDPTTGKTAGRRAVGEDRRTRARAAAEIDYSPLAPAVAAAIAEHDEVTAAIVAAGIDPDDPRAAFVRSVVRRMPRTTTPEQLKQNVQKAIAGEKLVSKAMRGRIADFEQRIAQPKGNPT